MSKTNSSYEKKSTDRECRSKFQKIAMAKLR